MKKIFSFLIILTFFITISGLKLTSNAETISIGDKIAFGSYVQSAVIGAQKEPLVWQVLTIDGDRALLLTEKIIDIAPYHNTWSNQGITWEKCSLRAFMNNDLYNTCFTESEKKAILLTRNINRDNPAGTPGGNDTDDYLFALSAWEVTDYLPYECIEDKIGGEWIHPYRQAFYTPLAEAKGGTKWEKYNEGFYWLRTPGEIPTEAANISCHGYGVYQSTEKTSSHYVTCGTYGVRPAMYISISELNKLLSPTNAPTNAPTSAPTGDSTNAPTSDPSSSPSNNSSDPTYTSAPTKAPQDTAEPSNQDNDFMISKALKIDIPTMLILILVLAATVLIAYYCFKELKK